MFCNFIEDHIRGDPNLSHFEDLYEAATNTEDYYVGADTDHIEIGSRQATRTIFSTDIPIEQEGGGNDSPALLLEIKL